MLALLLVLVACAPKIPVAYDVTEGGVDRAAVRRDGIAVAPVVLVKDLPAPPLPPRPEVGRVEQGLDDPNLPTPTVLDPVADAAFLRNEYTGNVRFGGGFVRMGDIALEVRARLMEFGLQDAYADQGARWLTSAVSAELVERGYAPTSLPAFAAPVPERVAVRGLHPDDGRDNVNLPRLELVPAPLAPESRAAGSPPWVLVPYLRAYYSHNGGWFLGQRFGCMAGSRVDVMLVLYDTRTGAPVLTMRALGRHLQERTGQASRAELDQYLLWAEDQVEEALRQGLLL